MRAFRKWNDLNQFHEVVKNLSYPRIHQCLKENDYTIPFGLKIKLHGTNACVRVEPDGKVVPQKRSSDIGFIEKMDGGYWTDNAGFAKWVQENEHYFSSLARSDATLYIYGEWCGPGIQTNVACSLTPRKTLWVFSIDVVRSETSQSRIYDPEMIDEVLGKGAPDTLIVVPWHVPEFRINFLEKAKTEEALAYLNRLTEEIGEKDPLLNELFDVEGHGEGVVAYPLLGDVAGCYYNDENYFSWFNFKAKSEAHRVNKTKKAANFDPEKFASVQIFADAYVTEQRLLQGFTEAVQGRKDMRLTPVFIKWVVTDIWKESKTEREASPDLDWKAVSKAISSRAVTWYKAKVQELEDA